MSLVYVNDQLVDSYHASISVFDHGFVVGDAVFETISVVDGVAFALTRHLERLGRSAKGLGLESIDLAVVQHAVELVLTSNPGTRQRLRVTLTSGDGPLGSSRLHRDPGLVVAIEEDERHDEPTSVFVVPYRKNEYGALAGLKTTSYAENAMALSYANEKGSSEAIFANIKGQLCEGTGSNVFYVTNSELFTPELSTGCLAGVTRELLCELIDTKQTTIDIAEFSPSHIDEAFLTSTLRDIQPIEQINGERFRDVPGPITKQAVAAFAELRATSPDP